ncbi:galactose-1-phosphate uridylyltransferase [Chloroflexota bacterium]
MSELRQDPTTKEWVILAPERGKRPQQKPKKVVVDELPAWDPTCPFCPGNEAQTPDEVFRIPITSENSSWEVRVVPNRFAALTLEGNVTRIEEGRFFRKMDGFGVHEVIIEGPSHNTPLALMTYEQVEKVVIAYQERYNSLKKNRQLKFIHIFKNHGWAAGTSLIHSHSQLVATPIMAPYYHRKFDVAHEYHADRGRCLYCDLIAWDLEKARNRVIAETKEFVIVHPYASRVPYETWILPKKHCASFGLFPAVHLAELSMVLKDTLFSLYKGLDNPSFNLMIDSTTTEDEDDPYYHWHIRIVPRLTTIAGFEMGSGIYISTALPEDTARLMKKVAASCAEDECISFK